MIKIKFMIKYFSIILLSFFFIQCSSKEAIKEKEEDKIVDARTDEQNKRKAVEHFVNGSVAESKGDFSGAVLEYQDALRLDPSGGIYFALAKNYLYLNKLSLALQNAKEAVRFDSSVADYYDLLADIYSAAHQPDSAAHVLEKLIDIDSTKINAHYKLARIYENGRPLKAISIYEKLTRLIGPEWNVLIRVSELYQRLGQNDKAADALEELLHIDPSNVALQKLLMDFYQKAENYEAALEIIDDILALTPDDLDARERKAKLLIDKGEWDAAAKEYSHILEKTDIPLDIKIRIGAAYFNRSLTDSSLLPIAREFFEKLAKDTTDWQVEMYLGAVELTGKNDSLAIQHFQKVTELANWNVEAWIRLGGLYFDNRKYDEAIKVMNEAIESFPKDFVINLILGLSLAQKEKHEEASRYLKIAVDLNPTDLSALSAYGYTLNQLKESDEAIKYMNRALDIDPDNVNLLGTLGLIYDSREDWERCDSVYERALELDSMSALINNNYAYSLSERDEQLERALEMVKISIEAEPDNSSYLDTIGWVYYKLGDYEKAKEYLEKAIEVGGESAVMFEHLGDVIFKMGNTDVAMDYWQKAFELDKTNDKLKQKIETGKI